MWVVLKKQNEWLRLEFQENEFTNINLNMSGVVGMWQENL